jgi:GT2 family glycosyltransferase
MPIALTEHLPEPEKEIAARMATENQSLLGPGTIDLSVVVLTAGCDWTMVKACLVSVFTACKKAGRRYEVIVIENSVSEEFHQSLLQDFSDIVLLRFHKKVGFCTSNNAGFRVSTGRYLLQLNDDTVVNPSAFKIMMDFMEAHPETGACGPLLLNRDGSVQYGISIARPRLIDHVCIMFGINRMFPNNPLVRQYHLMDDPLDVPREIDQPAGAALLYRRAMLNDVGLLDEDYIFGFDDVDICMRIKEAGWRIYRIPAATIVHYGTFSVNKNPGDETSDDWCAGMIYFYQKRRPHLAATFKLLLMASFVIRIPRLVALCLLGSEASRRHWRGVSRAYMKYFFWMLTHLFTPLPPRNKSNTPKPVLVNEPVARTEIVS